jgi:hypothetical protein
MGVLLMIAAVIGGWDMGRLETLPILARLGAISPSIIVLGLFLPACATRLPPIGSALLVLAAASASLVGALVGARAPHTRAAGIALGVFGFAALVRLLAWHLANYASLHASTGAWGFARTLSTIALVLEAIGQMTCAAWLGARGRITGQIGSAIALASAFFIVWASSRGGLDTASPWQAMLHLSLMDTVGNPPPHFGTGIAIFINVAALALAGAVVSQHKPPAAITTALALVLVSHGGLDVPLRALAAVTATVWIMVTMPDQRALWRSIPAKDTKASAEKA